MLLQLPDWSVVNIQMVLFYLLYEEMDTGKEGCVLEE